MQRWLGRALAGLGVCCFWSSVTRGPEGVRTTTRASPAGADPWARGQTLRCPGPLLLPPGKLCLVRLTPHRLNLALLIWCS